MTVFERHSLNLLNNAEKFFGKIKNYIPFVSSSDGKKEAEAKPEPATRPHHKPHAKKEAHKSASKKRKAHAASKRAKTSEKKAKVEKSETEEKSHEFSPTNPYAGHDPAHSPGHRKLDIHGEAREESTGHKTQIQHSAQNQFAAGDRINRVTSQKRINGFITSASQRRQRSKGNH
jgi:hypothetical protein